MLLRCPLSGAKQYWPRNGPATAAPATLIDIPPATIRRPSTAHTNLSSRPRTLSSTTPTLATIQFPPRMRHLRPSFIPFTTTATPCAPVRQRSHGAYSSDCSTLEPDKDNGYSPAAGAYSDILRTRRTSWSICSHNGSAAVAGQP